MALLALFGLVLAESPAVYLPSLNIAPEAIPGLGVIAVLGAFEPPAALVQAAFLLTVSLGALWGLGEAADREVRHT